jgi:hypothetical protein
MLRQLSVHAKKPKSRFRNQCNSPGLFRFNMMKLLIILASTAFLATAFRVNRQAQIPVEVTCGEGISTSVVNPGADRIPTIVRSHNFSSDYGYTYEDNMDCAVKFVADEALVYKLTFGNFYLEDATECQFDSLCVNGASYCGVTLQDAIIAYKVPAGKPFTLYFGTDSSITESGFEVLVEALPSTSASDEKYVHVDQCNRIMFTTPNVEYDYPTYDDYQYGSDQDASDSDRSDDTTPEYNQYEYYDDYQ